MNRIGILGGGPAGLYLALLVKKRRPDIDIQVFERSPRDATWGFGVVLADGGLRQLEAAEPESFRALEALMTWNTGQSFTVRGESVPIDKVRPGGAIERLAMLRILQEACARAGVRLTFDAHVTSLSAFEGYDLVVGADGANSLIRETFAAEFRTQKRLLTNRFAWFGASRTFPVSHLNFKEVPQGGALCGHYYTFKPGMSTFVMEADAAAWMALGLEDKTDGERRRITQAFFAEELAGAELIENNSIWRRFPVITNQRWYHDKYVLLGDALRTAHYSIGSGTRMALEDAMSLAEAITAGLPREEALERYAETRRLTMEKLAKASAASFGWYEHFSERMKGVSATEFALSFMRRTGRIDDARLVRDFPGFVAHARSKGLLPPAEEMTHA